jgi:hypothetical protein
VFRIKKSLKKKKKKGRWSIAIIFNFALEYAIRRVQVNHDGLELICTHQLLVYVDDVKIFAESVHIVKAKA